MEACIDYNDGLFFSINSCKREIIIDIPYIRIIYTPRRVLRTHRVNKEQNGNERQRDYNLHATIEGTSEN